jgi:hypothetical protein
MRAELYRRGRQQSMSMTTSAAVTRAVVSTVASHELRVAGNLQTMQRTFKPQRCELAMTLADEDFHARAVRMTLRVSTKPTRKTKETFIRRLAIRH